MGFELKDLFHLQLSFWIFRESVSTNNKFKKQLRNPSLKMKHKLNTEKCLYWIQLICHYKKKKKKFVLNCILSFLLFNYGMGSD